MHAVPAVSVLLPARDAAATLAASLRSVRRQRFTDWECVVVDDGSTDDTGGIARSLASADPRFAIVSTGRDGLVAALNAGLARCRAPLVARMDADDVMHRDRLGAQSRRSPSRRSFSRSARTYGSSRVPISPPAGRHTSAG